MSNENFEVIFAGKLVAGAQLDQVQAKVAAIFKTDAAKIAHLFSGNPVVIKKGIDQSMAQKYVAAMQAAGAICVIHNMASMATEVVSGPVASTAPSKPDPEKKGALSHAPPAPQTIPLSVSADQIADLKAGLAPVGSDMNQAKQAAVAVIPDISNLSMAPVGTELSTHKKTVQPPQLDISGLSIVKN